MKHNIGQLLQKRALFNADNEAYVGAESGHRITFGQLNSTQAAINSQTGCDRVALKRARGSRSCC